MEEVEVMVRVSDCPRVEVCVNQRVASEEMRVLGG